MKKNEILRGRNNFRQVAHGGTHLHSKYLRCTYILQRGDMPLFQVGLHVPSRYYKAVLRNRLRRVLREAITREKAVLVSALASSSQCVSMILMFKGKKDIRAERLRLQHLQPEVRRLFEQIANIVTGL